jgi:hypothetical protein
VTDASLRDKFAAKSERDQALVATSLVIFVWGITPLFIKEATFIVDVPTVTFYRNLCSPVVLWVISRIVTGGWNFQQIRKCLLPGALFGFSMIAGFIGVHETSVANSALIGALQPPSQHAQASAQHQKNIETIRSLSNKISSITKSKRPIQ